MSSNDVIELAKEKGARIVDLRFIDLLGLWQHFSIPISEIPEEFFLEGIGFDGASIPGFQTIDRSVAQKAEAHVKGLGIADAIYIGPERECVLFDSARFDLNYNSGYGFDGNSEAGLWNSGREGSPERPNLGYRPRYTQGYFPVPLAALGARPRHGFREWRFRDMSHSPSGLESEGHAIQR
jgi:glutamine synthetase